MYVIKVQFGEVNRRLVLQEPYTFKSLLQMVTSRFELSPPQAVNAQLRYVDPDGDLISMNTDAELCEALALLTHSNQAEVQPLRMKLLCPEVCCESPGSEDSIVLVDQMEKRFSANMLSEQVKERLEETSDQIKQVELARLEAEEAAKAALEAEEKRLFEEEQARVAAEEEERARAAKIAAEEQERVRLQEEEEKRQRCEIAISAEKEDSGKRILSLWKMGCSVDVLRSIFSAELIEMVVSSSAVQVEVHDFADCVDSQMDLIDEKAEDADYSEEPEPTVNWELQRAMKEQESKGDSFPSAEQKLAVLEAGRHAQDLATQLTEFYLIHNPEHVAKVPVLVKMYKSRNDELDRALMDRYHCDLSTFRGVAPVQTPIDETSIEARLFEDCAPAAISSHSANLAPAPVLVEEPMVPAPAEPAAPAEPGAPANEKLDSAISTLYEMGIEAPLERMKAVLEKYDYNLEAALTEFLG